MTKPSRYLHEKQDWNDFDIFPDCKEEIVLCPKGYKGHKVYWLNQSVWRGSNDGVYYQIVIRVNHAHFVRNRDTGRHVDDIIGTTWIHEKYLVVTRRLDYAKLPYWIKEENEKGLSN